MDLLVGDAISQQSIFCKFIKSTVIKKIIKDINDTLNIDILIVDYSGNLIISPNFCKKDNKEINYFDDFIQKNILGFHNKYNLYSCQFIDSCNTCFVSAPIIGTEATKNLGYIIGGPYVLSSSPKVNEINTKIINTPISNLFTYQKEAISSSMQKIIIKTLDSYGRMIGLLFEEKLKAQKHFSRLSGLNHVSTAISKILDTKQLLEQVLDKAIELLCAKNGSIMLSNKDCSKLEVVIAKGESSNNGNARFDIEESITGKVACDGKPMLLLKGIKVSQSTSKKETQNLPSAMLVPLCIKDEIIGVLNISEKLDGENFTDEDLDLLQALASNAAVAIHNANLYDDLEGKVQQLGALFELSTAIVSSLDRKEVLEKVLNNAIQLLCARDGSLMLLNKEKEILEIEVAFGLPEKVIHETKIRIGEGISGKVALEGKPRLLKKGIKEAESKTETVAREVPSALSVPLKFKNKIIGVLNVKEKTTEDNFTNHDLEILTMLASLAAVAIENAELHKNLEDLFVNSIRALANAIEARDPYTRGHSERVTEYSVKISEYMGINNELIKKIKYAALLHDIGKINIKEEILNKPGRLTDEEFKIMHKHPTMGAKIMEPVKEFREMLPYMYHHHERYGAGGYPDGVRGEQIPLPARILAVADAFDAMTTDRPYRKALPLSVAIDELQKNSGTQFDPKVVTVFLNICDNEPEWISITINSFRDECPDEKL